MLRQNQLIFDLKIRMIKYFGLISFVITLGQPIFGKAGGVGKVWEKMTIALARRMRTLRVIFKSKERISSVDIGSNQS